MVKLVASSPSLHGKQTCMDEGDTYCSAQCSWKSHQCDVHNVSNLRFKSKSFVVLTENIGVVLHIQWDHATLLKNMNIVKRKWMMNG